MAQKMLIDASHPEETRVVVVDGTRLIDFDFETSTKKQLKGNIYLAKVTRVEPSLQAAFVDYGGNRHGFLAFSEIHPDYYQIPVADRQALEQETQEAAKAIAREQESEAAEPLAAEAKAEAGPDEGGPEAPPLAAQDIETVSGDDFDESERRHRILAQLQALKRYNIQEVIRKRQILLVQVVKEERGTKGAALTTYISLAGRYCVLMPNTPRGGGISRKIAKPEDRKRLKKIMGELPLDSRTGIILRTAGMARSKAEIKRDFDYLMRLWDDIRERTLKSTAPALIHEEANLIKRAIRDLYSRDIQEILIEGEEAHKTAKEFMRMMTPSHAARVKLHAERVPLYQRFQVEGHLDALYRNTVALKSGGYIVLNPTEALVAIDVNSGRSTKERNIEETATKTNLEAAEEIARQLRLRDLAGLIVIDFIDMNESRNDRLVEKRLKEAVKSDRARIQMGRISHFGLLELSRQRLRPSFLEVNTEVCAVCGGTGYVRSVESSALQVLRAVESEALREEGQSFTLTVPTRVALYLLNQKRATLNDIEARYRARISVQCDDGLVAPAYRLERQRVPAPRAEAEPAKAAEDKPAEAPSAALEPAPARIPEAAARKPEVAAEGEGSRKRRRRGRRGGRRRRGGGQPPSEAQVPASFGAGHEGGETDGGGEAYPAAEEAPSEAVSEPEEPSSGAVSPAAHGAPSDEAPEGQRRRRRRRRGRRDRPQTGERPGEISGMGEVAAETAGEETGAGPSAGRDEAPLAEFPSEPVSAERKEANDEGPILPAIISDNAAQPVDDFTAAEARAKPARRGWWKQKE